MNAHAIAIDLGATSVRFAHGTFDGERIDYRIVDQQPNVPKEFDGRPHWDFGALLGFCKQAAVYAKSAAPEATVGIDSWGVDFGLLDESLERILVHDPICYRDPAHQRAFDVHAEYRHRLYELTGIAHQPFNTIYQLIARREEDPSLIEAGVRWLILPDLLSHFLGAEENHELTQASTTQLMGVDGTWCPEAFAIAGWPVPETQPQPPGRLSGRTSEGVGIVRVGSHDTASAVLGLGTLQSHEVFLNVGTWSLLGCILDRPLVTSEAEEANFSNEWTVDGRVRFLKNIPGFYVINRLHEELKITCSVPEWIECADFNQEGRIDLLAEDFFNPDSMLDAVRLQLHSVPETPEGWAGVALMSLVEGTAGQLDRLEHVSGRKFTSIRLAGGGSNSRPFAQELARASRRTVLAGPAEATVVGNLGVQFLAQGHFTDWKELGEFLRRSADLRVYDRA